MLPLPNRKTLLVVAWLATTLGGGAWARANPAPPVSADERRLGAAALRAELKKRGLTEILELHLSQFPPATETDTRLMMRDVRLAEADDVTRPEADRLAALVNANELLDQLIESLPEDSRRFEWRFTLAHSLLYEEGDRFLTSLLYRGGNDADRAALRQRSTRAVAVLTGLLDDLTAELQRIDELDVREFEKLDATGYMEQIDRLGPRSQYLRLWAWYYDALAREPGDAVRDDALAAIHEELSAHPDWLERPHQVSRVQVQVLVLAGMALRLSGRPGEAREYLDRAIEVAEAIEDVEERDRVDWAVTLAWIEGARSDRDAARFDDALDRVARFRAAFAGRQDAFALDTVAAMTERSVAKAAREAADVQGDARRAAEWWRRGWQPLVRLVERYPPRRDEIYATVYATVDPTTDAGKLDPLEQAATVAGLLFEASIKPDECDRLLAQAVEVGRVFGTRGARDAPDLLPEVRFNTAVALYRSGRQVDAARAFLEVASDHPTFRGAAQAARIAVQLGADLYGDPALRSHPEAQRLFRDALEVVLARGGDDEVARYWRFYYAQLLEDLGEYALAADEYARVDEGHEYYLHSLFSRARCLAVLIQSVVASAPAETLELQRLTNAFFDAHRAFVARAGQFGAGAVDAQAAATVRSLMARASVTAAQLQVLPHIDRPAQAMDALADFEVAYPTERSLVGAVWRVRLLGYERLGRLDDAARALPAYVAADPEGAGATLQTLYDTLVEQIATLRNERNDGAAGAKAEIALLLAREIQDWATREGPSRTGRDTQEITVQLAEAYLEAGQPDQARSRFEPLMPASLESVDRLPPQSLRVVVGYAESLYQRGDLVEALRVFNKLATGLAPDEPLRWQSLLRDLQCRTALEHPPEGIIKVIQQQSFLYPDLGGERQAAEFQKLRRENQRRAAGRP